MADGDVIEFRFKVCAMSGRGLSARKTIRSCEMRRVAAVNSDWRAQVG